MACSTAGSCTPRLAICSSTMRLRAWALSMGTLPTGQVTPRNCFGLPQLPAQNSGASGDAVFLMEELAAPNLDSPLPFALEGGIYAGQAGGEVVCLDDLQPIAVVTGRQE